jgi:hypothetical protein
LELRSHSIPIKTSNRPSRICGGENKCQTSQWLSALRRSAKRPSLYNLSSPACHRPHRLGQLASCPRRQECPRARPASERAGRDRDEDVGSGREGQREANECGRVQPMKALPTVASPPLTPNDVNALVRPSDQSRHGFSPQYRLFVCRVRWENR